MGPIACISLSCYASSWRIESNSFFDLQNHCCISFQFRGLRWVL